MRIVAITVVISMTAATAYAAGSHNHASPYQGEEKRQIKSLSAADIDELSRGGGWGFAKVAELNGVPGPAHLLELKDDIPLKPGQIVAIQALFQKMNAEARTEGARLIALERALDRRFRENTVTEAILESALQEIGEVRSSLRFIHLRTHLKTPAILTAEQIERYNQLRGYETASPCDAVPSGHNAALWRQHNGCE